MSPSAGGALVLNNEYRMRPPGGITPAVQEYLDTAALIVQPGVAMLSKTTASAMTLAAPATDQDGLTLVITSSTAAAHTVTGVALIADGVSGSPHSTATFAAFKGATITLLASKGLWNVVSALGVTTA